MSAGIIAHAEAARQARRGAAAMPLVAVEGLPFLS
jgi:hypothetical protein